MDSSNLREAPSMEGSGEKLKEFFAQLVMLWWAGVREACCLHRVLFFCKRSRILLKRTGQCFLLNGCIFLGSIFLLKFVITPVLQWILPVNSQHQAATDVQYCDYCPITEAGERFYLLLQTILFTLFYVLWFYPMYVFSFIISSIWYNEIAKQACIIMKQSDEVPQKLNSGKDKVLSTEAAINHDGLEGMMLMIGEQIYSILMITIFFIEVSAVGYIPYIGKLLNFILQSWIYAYYCFEYKWNFIEWSLSKRIYFFETNWAFFAGFGSPCVLATFFSSQLISSGIMAILFPLFVLSATAAHPEQVIATFSKRWTHNRLRQVPLFYVPNATSVQVLRFLAFIGKKKDVSPIHQTVFSSIFSRSLFPTEQKQEWGKWVANHNYWIGEDDLLHSSLWISMFIRKAWIHLESIQILNFQGVIIYSEELTAANFRSPKCGLTRELKEDCSPL